MRMEISAEDSNLDTPMGRTSGWNETMDLGQLKGRDLRRRVEIEEKCGLRLGVLCDGHSVGNLRGGCRIRRARDGGDSLSELKRIQRLVQCLVEIRNLNLRLPIDTRNEVCWSGERIKRIFRR